jgi:hypothetical protein
VNPVKPSSVIILLATLVAVVAMLAWAWHAATRQIGESIRGMALGFVDSLEAASEVLPILISDGEIGNTVVIRSEPSLEEPGKQIVVQLSPAEVDRLPIGTSDFVADTLSVGKAAKAALHWVQQHPDYLAPSLPHHYALPAPSERSEADVFLNRKTQKLKDFTWSTESVEIQRLDLASNRDQRIAWRSHTVEKYWWLVKLNGQAISGDENLRLHIYLLQDYRVIEPRELLQSKGEKNAVEFFKAESGVR